jgi:prefoldin subunit 5
MADDHRHRHRQFDIKKIILPQMTIDIGTGYLIEGGATSALKFLDNKEKALNDNLSNIKKAVNSKQNLLQECEHWLQQNIKSAQEQQEAMAKVIAQ